MKCKENKLFTLSIRGQNKTVSVIDEENKNFDWCNAIIDSLIAGAVAGGASYTTALSDGVITTIEPHFVLASFFVAFVGWIAAKRGIKE